MRQVEWWPFRKQMILEYVRSNASLLRLISRVAMRYVRLDKPPKK